MDFFDNVVNKSNAIIKDVRLSNPFGSKQSKDEPDIVGQVTSATSVVSSESNGQQTTPVAANATDSSIELNQTTTPKVQDTTDLSDDKNSQFAAIAADAEAVAQKAAKGAKTFGTFLFSMANKAGQTVSQTAKQVKQAVESTSILTEFTREQQEFIKEHGGQVQTGADLPWTSVNDETQAIELRDQILSLSQDKRNFVRSPPSDAEFKFDAQLCYPVALSLLKEDPNLGKMRYELVPKLVNEDTFWCNYFYRVFMLKQMIEKGESGGRSKKGWASSRSSSGEGPDELQASVDEPLSPGYSVSVNSELQQQSPPQPQLQQSQTTKVQESFNLNTMANQTGEQQLQEDYNQALELESSESRKLFAEADDLKSKLRELNIGSFNDDDEDKKISSANEQVHDNEDDDDDAKWEEELQRDLQEFELVSGGDVSAMDEETLKRELQQLEEAQLRHKRKSKE